MRALGELRGGHGWLQGCEEGAGEGVSGRREILGLELGRWRGGRGRRIGRERRRSRQRQERRPRGEELGDREPQRAEAGRFGIWKVSERRVCGRFAEGVRSGRGERFAAGLAAGRRGYGDGGSLQ